MRKLPSTLTSLLMLLAAAPATAQSGAVRESSLWSLRMYLTLRHQITNERPDLVICGAAAASLAGQPVLATLTGGPAPLVDSLRVLPTCPKLFRDALRQRDILTVFVTEWPRQSDGLFRATACKWGCSYHRLEEYTTENVGSVRFSVWAVDD